MKYSLIKEQILSMNCKKTYKPILILAYLDFLEITSDINFKNDKMININDLFPFFMYYIKLDPVNNSAYGIMDFEAKSHSELMDIIVGGPLFKIQNDVSLFKAELVDNNYYFGFATDNPSIDYSRLFNEVRSACYQLIGNLTNTDIEYHDLSIYKEMIHQIKTTKIDIAHNPKIYKYLVILSYVDYFCDLGIEHLAFKQMVATPDLFTYYKLYFNIEEFSKYIQTPAIKDGSDSFVFNHMLQLPIRKLCKDNTFFKLKQLDANSRKLENLPTEFGIIIDDNFDNNCMISLVRYAVSNMIYYHTSKFIDINLVYNINYTDSNSSSSRFGQHQYRKGLIERYNCTCAICNLDLEYVLVASHARPWRDCKSTHEKLSANNGLLLCEYHDALFDKGFITFDSNNNFEVIFSPQMTDNSIEHFYSFYDNKIPKYVNLYPKIGTYLQYHQNNIFKN